MIAPGVRLAELEYADGSTGWAFLPDQGRRLDWEDAMVLMDLLVKGVGAYESLMLLARRMVEPTDGMNA